MVSLKQQLLFGMSSDQALNSFMEFLNTGSGRATEKIHVLLVFFFGKSNGPNENKSIQIIDSGTQSGPYSTLLHIMF